jgi:hypothetical protein
MTPRGLWLRLGGLTALTVALVLTLAPAVPAARVPAAAALAAGTAAGIALAVLALRARPRLALTAGGTLAFALKVTLFGVCAAAEEGLWRRVVLGELLFAGTAAALAGSSVAFALAHRTHRGLHLGTGAAFGGLYLATGALAASIAAHCTYNLLVAGFVARAQT